MFITFESIPRFSAIVWLISLILTWWLTRPNVAVRVLDHPNPRSLHATPVPRTGGIAIMAATGVGYVSIYLIYGADLTLGWIVTGALTLAVVSLWEDILGVSRLTRLIAQVLAALLLPIAGLAVPPLPFTPWVWALPTLVAWGFTILLTVWMTNLYNFMDGMDGFAGGMAVIGFATMAALGWQAHAYEFSLINALIAAAAGGFLVWNFPPARIFMGDSGSIPLGYLAAAMALWGQHASIFPLWYAGLVFSPFIVDATLTILLRLRRCERIFDPHCTHYYQRLVRSGWGHRHTVLHAYVLMLACAGSVLEARNLPPAAQVWLAIVWGVIYWLLARRIDILISRNYLPSSPPMGGDDEDKAL